MQRGPKLNDPVRTVLGTAILYREDVFPKPVVDFRDARSDYVSMEGSQDLWLYIPSQKRFVGYHAYDRQWIQDARVGRILVASPDLRRRIGYLGPAGFYGPAEKDRPEVGAFFQTNPLRAANLRVFDPYAFDPGALLLLREGPKVWLADFATRHLIALPNLNPGETILGSRTLFWPWLQDAKAITAESVHHGIAVVTSSQIELLRTDGTLLWSAPLEGDPYKFDQIRLYGLPDGDRFIIAYWKERQSNEYLTEVSTRAGSLTHRVLPKLPWQELPANPKTHSPDLEQAGIFSALWTPPAAIPLASALEGPLDQLLWEWGLNFDWLQQIAAKSFDGCWIDYWCLSIALSVLTIALISRRCAFAKAATLGWSIAAILFGPSAVALLLCLRDWPTRERCPVCGKQRVVHRELCEHCGAAWDAPAALLNLEPEPRAV